MAIDFKQLSPKRINQNNHLSTSVYTSHCLNVFIQNEYIVADWRIGWMSSFREMNDAARIEIKCRVNMINELRVMATRNRSHKIQSEKDNFMWYQKRLLHTHTHTHRHRWYQTVWNGSADYRVLCQRLRSCAAHLVSQ